MNAERLLQHFDRIAEAPDAVAHLRRFILDLAVRGKLVDQDPHDEPASELIKKIQAEKEKLLQGGEIKKIEKFEQSKLTNLQFILPTGWQVADSKMKCNILIKTARAQCGYHQYNRLSMILLQKGLQLSESDL